MSDKAKKITAVIVVIILLLGLGAAATYLCYIEKIDISIGSSNQPAEGPINLFIGDKQLVAPIFPDKIYISKKVKYESSNEDIASVTQSGEIQAKKVGTTTITITTVLFNRKASIEVNVAPGMPDEVIITPNDKNKQYIDITKDENYELEEVVFTAKTKRKTYDSYDPENTKFMWSVWDIHDPDNQITLLDSVITENNEIKFKPKNTYQDLKIVCTVLYNDKGLIRMPAKGEGSAAVYQKISLDDFKIVAKDDNNENIIENSTIEMGKEITFDLYFVNSHVDKNITKEFYYSANSKSFKKIEGPLLIEELGNYVIKVKVSELGNTYEKEYNFDTKYAPVSQIFLDKTKEIRPLNEISGFTLTATWDRFAAPTQEVTFNLIGYDELDTKVIKPYSKTFNNEAFIEVGANKDTINNTIKFSINGEMVPDIVIDIKHPSSLKIIVQIGETKSETFEYTLATKEVKNIKVFANLDNDFKAPNIKQKSDATIGANRLNQTVYLAAKNYPLDSFVNVKWYVNGKNVEAGVHGNFLELHCEDIGEYHVYCTDQKGDIKSNTIVIPSVDTTRSGHLSKDFARSHFDYLGDYNGRSVNTYITSQSDLDSFIEYSILTDSQDQTKTTNVYVDTCMQSIWETTYEDLYTGELFWVAEQVGKNIYGYYYCDNNGNKTNMNTPIDPITKETHGSVARSFYRLNYSGNFSGTVLNFNILNKNIDITILSPTDVPTVQFETKEIENKYTPPKQQIIEKEEHRDRGVTKNAIFGYKEKTNNKRHFAIDDIEQTVTVSTSSQLYDAVENGYRPICVPGSNADLIYNQAREILSTYLFDGDSEYQKVKFINDWIVFNVAYDMRAAKYIPEKNGDINDSLKFGAFFLEGVFSIPGFEQHLAVCDGRSKAFTLMCSIEGIRSIRVTGSTNGNNGHAWNKVYIATPTNPTPAWYIVDTTWAEEIATAYNGVDVTKEIIIDSSMKDFNQYRYYFLSTDKYHNTPQGYTEDRKVGGIPPAVTEIYGF